MTVIILSDDQAAASGKKLTKAQTDAKKYKWKKINATVPENKFDGAFSDPPDKVVHSPLTYLKNFIDDDCIRRWTEQTNIHAMQKDSKECSITTDEMESMTKIKWLQKIIQSMILFFFKLRHF